MSKLREILRGGLSCQKEKEADQRKRSSSARAVFLYLVVFLVLLNTAPASAFPNNINLTFTDEDTNTLLNPTVTVNGASATVTNGTMDFNTSAATVDVNISLSGYMDKWFKFGFPGDVNLLYTVSLLTDTNAQNIQFKLRTEDGTSLITDANIFIVSQDNNNLVGASIIGADSLFNAVLKPVGKDYNFHVTGSGITDYNYSKQELIINNVINEATLENLEDTGMVTVTNPGSFVLTSADLGITSTPVDDSFIGADGDPPNAANWDRWHDFTINDANILDNNLSMIAFTQAGNRAIVGIESDINFIVGINGAIEVKCVSASRPFSTSVSHGNRCGLFTPPRLSFTSMPFYGLYRLSDGRIYRYTTGGSGLAGLDLTTGELPMSTILTRQGNNYLVEFYINDTNLLYSETVTDTNTFFKAFSNVETTNVGGAKTDANVSSIVVNLYNPIAKVFPFTKEFYSINVDFNSNYYARTYKRRLEKVGSETLQPYLVKRTDGVSVIIGTIESKDISTPIPNILVRTKKQIAGTVEVESIITDSKGESLQSYIVGDTYILEFYDIDETLLFTMSVEATSNLLLVFIQDANAGFQHQGQVSVSVGFKPSAGRVFTTTDLVQTISVANSTIDRIEIVVTNRNEIIAVPADVNVFDTNYTVGVENGYINTINAGVLGGDQNNFYELTVYVHLANGTVLVKKTTYTLPLGIDGLALLNTGIKSDIGCGEDCPFLMLVSIFITLGALSGAIILLGDIIGGAGTVVLAILLLGVFTYIGWFPFGLFVPTAVIGAFVTVGMVAR